MKENHKIRGVIFDLGETLLNFGHVSKVGVFRQSARLTYDFLKSKPQPVGSFRGYLLKNLLYLRLQYGLSNIKGRDFDSLELLKKVNRKLRLSEEQWEELLWLWYEPLGRLAKIESDIIETLMKLERLGLKLGILSNTFIHSSSLNRQLENLKIMRFFSVRLYSYQFRFRKPDIRIFKAAAETIGLEAKNILYVGDRVSTDIIPAIKAGMRAVLKSAHTNHGKKLPPKAYAVSMLSELPALINQINSIQKNK